MLDSRAKTERYESRFQHDVERIERIDGNLGFLSQAQIDKIGAKLDKRATEREFGIQATDDETITT